MCMGSPKAPAAYVPPPPPTAREQVQDQINRSDYRVAGQQGQDALKRADAFMAEQRKTTLRGTLAIPGTGSTWNKDTNTAGYNGLQIQ